MFSTAAECGHRAPGPVVGSACSWKLESSTTSTSKPPGSRTASSTGVPMLPTGATRTPASSPPTFFFTPTLEQYAAILDSNAGVSFLNSAIATAVSTRLVIAMAVPAAYALSIRPVKRTQDVLFFFISTKMLPIVAVIMPIYVIAGQIGMLDNLLTLIILYLSLIHI